MFYGEYEHTVDKKGRAIIPARFRDVLRDKFVDAFIVTTGYERCLFVFPPDQWQVFEQTLRAQSLHQPDPRAVSRILYSGTNQCPCDKQGRINLPQGLLDYAEIKKEITIIGVSTRFEIWARDEWKSYKQEVMKEGGLEKRAEKMEVKIE
ncbi:division/cell wall cluster transcriptional repressor MraZ [candidate division NPL-UPA2 bacterium]|nr:division/cell wall cluster transcriptional repressor MraZ [candidate division NPL-UPA2 bacterium]